MAANPPDLRHLRELLTTALELHSRGELTEAHLREALELLEEEGRAMQDLLYLQASSTSPFASINGLRMVCAGEDVDLPREPAEWPYQTVMDALRDGWRIISFPNLALMMDESRTVGLGCEFILER